MILEIEVRRNSDRAWARTGTVARSYLYLFTVFWLSDRIKIVYKNIFLFIFKLWNLGRNRLWFSSIRFFEGWKDFFLFFDSRTTRAAAEMSRELMSAAANQILSKIIFFFLRFWHQLWNWRLEISCLRRLKTQNIYWK